MITKKDLIREIKKQYKRFLKENYEKLKNETENYKNYYIKIFFNPNFLGFVENKDLDDNALSYFAVYKNNNPYAYDWVNGNENLKELIKEIEAK